MKSSEYTWVRARYINAWNREDEEIIIDEWSTFTKNQKWDTVFHLTMGNKYEDMGKGRFVSTKQIAEEAKAEEEAKVEDNSDSDEATITEETVSNSRQLNSRTQLVKGIVEKVLNRMGTEKSLYDYRLCYMALIDAYVELGMLRSEDVCTVETEVIDEFANVMGW